MQHVMMLERGGTEPWEATVFRHGLLVHDAAITGLIAAPGSLALVSVRSSRLTLLLKLRAGGRIGEPRTNGTQLLANPPSRVWTPPLPAFETTTAR